MRAILGVFLAVLAVAGCLGEADKVSLTVASGGPKSSWNDGATKCSAGWEYDVTVHNPTDASIAISKIHWQLQLEREVAGALWATGSQTAGAQSTVDVTVPFCPLHNGGAPVSIRLYDRDHAVTGAKLLAKTEL